MDESPLSLSRAAGVLLHPTSLPGRFGIGDLGPQAYAWVDDLHQARQSWWQVLPLGPTGLDASPYQSYSAFAGNTNLISPELLQRDGLLNETDYAAADFPPGQVEIEAVIGFKEHIVTTAWNRFRSQGPSTIGEQFETFVHEQESWLADFAFFMALREEHGCLWEWPDALRGREERILREAAASLADAVERNKFGQFLFYRQWHSLRDYARERGVRMFGDLPIFVSGDSADVWAHPDWFLLDERGKPTVVAGVPPDYFSPTGQRWGNPIYDWKAMAKSGYSWWIDRMRATMAQVDCVRLDHFRGFEACWHVPASEPTAQHGEWVAGPRDELFAALRQALGNLPFVAEDLGLITPEVEALRDRCQLPGMRVLQFAFDNGPSNRFLPHHYDRQAVVYTGTHDNDTTRGWYQSLSRKSRKFYRQYVGKSGRDPAWELIQLAWSSVANLAIAPVQDVLSLGSEARMNRPGEPGGNWRWRLTESMLTSKVFQRLADVTETYSRAPERRPAPPVEKKPRTARKPSSKRAEKPAADHSASGNLEPADVAAS